MNSKETKKRGKFRRFGAFVLALSMIFGSSTPAIAVAAPTPIAVEERVEKPAATPAETPKEAPAKTEVTPAQPEETAPAEKQPVPAKTEEKPAVETPAAPAKAQKNAPAEDGLEIGPENVPEAVGAPTVDKKLKLKINPPSIGSQTVSGTGVVGDNRRKKQGDVTITVTVTDSAGTPQETQTLTIKPTDKVVKGAWSVPLGRKLQNGDVVKATQAIETYISEETSITVQPLMKDRFKDKLTMPTGEIWIEQTSSNQVNDDEQAEALRLLKAANPDIADDIVSAILEIDGTNKAWFKEIKYKDDSKSDRVEAPNLKIKQVTEYSREAKLDTITVVDNVIKGKLEGEGPFDGIKVQIVTKVSDADKETYCKEGKCTVDKDSAKPVDAKVDSTTGEFSYTWGGATLPLDQIVGVIVKEKNKFKSCSRSTVKPVTVSPTEVRDPRKLTNADKAAIEQTIRKAYTGADHTSKLPDGTGEHEGIPAPIVFNEDGSVSIFSGNDVEVKKWDDDGKPIPEKNSDGTNKLQDGAKPFATILAKDLVKNIAPKSPSIAVDTDTGKVTVTPPAYKDPGDDTDLLSYTLTYKDASGAEKTVTATRDLKTNKWSGEGVNEDGTITLDVNKLEVGGTLTATAKDNGGLEGDENKLDSDPATKKLETATVSYNFGQSEEGTPGEGNMVGKTVNQGSKYKLLDNAFTLKYHKFKAWEVNGKEVAAGTEITVTKDTVVKAVWERLKVKVTYKPGDGSGKMDGLTENSETVEAGTYYKFKQNTFKAPDHKEFDTWSIGNSRVTAEGVQLEEADITVTALWKWKKVKVTYKAGEGSGDMTDLTGNVEEADESQPYTVRKNSFTAPENKEFDIWQADVPVGATQEELKKKPEEVFKIYENTTLTAQWKFIEVKITYDPGEHGSGASVPKKASQNQDYVIENVSFTPETNYKFIGWKADGDDTKLYKTDETINAKTGRTLTAQWELMERKITFAPNGGSGEMNPNPVIKLVGDKYKLPTCEFTAPDENQEFDTWEIDGKRVAVGTELTVEKDTVVKALWKPIVWELTEDPGEEGKEQKTTNTVNQGTKYIVPQPNKFTAKNPEQYEFSHWTVNGEKKAPGTEIVIKGKTEVVAHWKIQKKTVTYENGGGDGKMDPVTRDYGTRFTLPQPTAFTAPANKEFSHWEITGDSEPRQPGYAFDLTKNITVTAVWKDSAFTVTYVANGGSGTMNPDTVLKKDGQGYILKDNGFTPQTGWEFEGWKIGSKVYPAGANYPVTGNTTATAQWRLETIGITFKTEEGGEGSGNASLRHPKGVLYYLPKPEFKAKDGYQFKGWKIGDNPEIKKAGTSTTFDRDAVITAVWDQLVTVTYDANEGAWFGGNTKITNQVPKNTSFKLSWGPMRKGYVFLGWQQSEPAVQDAPILASYGTHDGTDENLTFKAVWREKGSSGGSGNTPGVPPVIPGTEPGTPPVTPGTEPSTPPVTPGTEPGTPSMPSDGGIPDRDALLRRLKSLWNSSEMRRLLEQGAKKGQNGSAIPRAGVGTAERTASTVLFPVDLMPAKEREDD